MTRVDIIEAFCGYRERIKSWFDDKRREVDPKSVTWMHFEEGFKAGYAQRQKEEQAELEDAL